MSIECCDCKHFHRVAEACGYLGCGCPSANFVIVAAARPPGEDPRLTDAKEHVDQLITNAALEMRAKYGMNELETKLVGMALAAVRSAR